MIRSKAYAANNRSLFYRIKGRPPLVAAGGEVRVVAATPSPEPLIDRVDPIEEPIVLKEPPPPPRMGRPKVKR